MPTIMPVTDLRNYGDVLREVAPGKPVFLTRNGRGRYVVADIGDWDALESAGELIALLNEGKASLSEGSYSVAEARAHLAERIADASA